MLSKFVKALNLVVVGGALLIAGLIIVSIWLKDGDLFEIPGIMQLIFTYLVVLVVFGVVRRAVSLERLVRPRIEDNGLTPPDGTDF